MAWSSTPQNQGWGNVPQTPTWKDPSAAAKVNPQLYPGLAQQNTYGSNPYQDPGFAKQAQQANTAGYGLINQGRGMASSATGAGGWLSNPEAYNSYFGLKPLDINDPGVVKDLGSWNQMYMGQQRNAMDEYLGKAAGASANQYGRGIGVRGGPDQQNQMFHDAMKTLAGGVTGNINQSVSNMKDLYAQQSGTAGQFANAYSNMMNSLLGAGGTQTGQALTALQSLQGGRNEWLQGRQRDDAANTGAYNQQVQQAQALERQRAQQAQQQGQAQDTQQNNLEQYRNYMTRLNQPNYGGNWGMGDAGMLDYYRTQLGTASPWQRTEQVQRKA